MAVVTEAPVVGMPVIESPDVESLAPDTPVVVPAVAEAPVVSPLVADAEFPAEAEERGSVSVPQAKAMRQSASALGEVFIRTIGRTYPNADPHTVLAQLVRDKPSTWYKQAEGKDARP